MIVPGTYRHYKGGMYEVLFAAKDKTSGKTVVVYKSANHGTLYTRSIEEFTSKVKNKETGIEIPRFLFVVEALV